MSAPELDQGNPMIRRLFVYGTLKRGQCRGSMWPRKPQRIETAFIRARLYDLGLYPAIRVDGLIDDHEARGVEDGLDWVEGELWTFAREDIPATIAELDEIEETNQPGVCNLYDHVMVRAFDAPNSHHSELALVYQYSCDDRLAHSRRLRPADGESSVAWPAASGKP
jgi:gamma-glutamylcyclotransferase (GGCT)/AIG2-like uncharacterized protein YtfP